MMEGAVASAFDLKKVAKTKGNKIPLLMRRLMRLRKNLGRKLAKSRCPVTIGALREQLVVTETSITSSHAKYSLREESMAAERCKTDPSYFYSFTKKKTRVQSPVGPLACPDGSLTSSEKEMAEILLLQYSAVFSTPTEPSTQGVAEELFPRTPSPGGPCPSVQEHHHQGHGPGHPGDPSQCPQLHIPRTPLPGGPCSSVQEHHHQGHGPGHPGDLSQCPQLHIPRTPSPGGPCPSVQDQHHPGHGPGHPGDLS